MLFPAFRFNMHGKDGAAGTQSRSQGPDLNVAAFSLWLPSSQPTVGDQSLTGYGMLGGKTPYPLALNVVFVHSSSR